MAKLHTAPALKLTTTTKLENIVTDFQDVFGESLPITLPPKHDVEFTINFKHAEPPPLKQGIRLAEKI